MQSLPFLHFFPFRAFFSPSKSLPEDEAAILPKPQFPRNKV